MKVTVNQGWQINHKGKLHQAGETFEMDDRTAESMIANGRVVKVKAKAKAPTKAITESKNKAVTQAEAKKA
jgi:hypothetical protein